VTVTGEGGLIEQLFWRDEILQAMYWMHGEGLGEALSPATLVNLLDTSEARIATELRRMTAEGYVAAECGNAYRLTELGLETGKRTFSDEFAGLTRSAHGACGPGCVCHRHAGAAAACRAAS
jgi:hypothetical protein